MMGPQRMFGMTPWVRRLLVATLLVFLLQLTIFAGPRFIAAFGLDPLQASARPWTFVTYMFLHGGILHLAFNLLALFVFGPPVEERMGSHGRAGSRVVDNVPARRLRAPPSCRWSRAPITVRRVPPQPRYASR